MQIDSLTVRNYRCISEIKLENIAPITIFVGRNNTGKSAMLEAVALATTGYATWYDSLDTDILSSIIHRRGGGDYADMMIKLGEKRAEISGSGNNFKADLLITRNIENLSDEVASLIYSTLNQHLEGNNVKFNRAMDRYLTELPLDKKELFFGLLQEYSEWLRKNVSNLFKIIISYKSNLNNESEFALLGYSEELKNFVKDNTRKINEIFALRDRAKKPKMFKPVIFQIDELIRSQSQSKSNTLFLLDSSILFFQNLMKRLTRSGKLISLIEFLKDNINYFEDIREANKNFLIFLKGLNRPVPLEAMGDGFRIKLILLSAIANIKKGIALMEEPENNLHPGYMSLVANQIVKTAATKEVQYFISTHSLEFIKFLLEEDSSLVKIVRMYRMEDEPEIDYEILSDTEAIEEYKVLKMDLRGI
jgi:AAA15 family ATPase/GTPase